MQWVWIGALLLAAGVLISTVLLRASCWFYNKLRGGDHSAAAVPPPSFGRAVGIVVTVALIQLIINLVFFVCVLIFGTGGDGSSGFNLSNNRPVAAVFLFDTSPSMAYKTSDGATRLDDARKRGLELLDKLPLDSRVVVLDTADSGTESLSVPQTTPQQARERIQNLKISPAAGSVTHRLPGAYTLLADLATSKDDPGSKMPRLVVVFSDRTRASWNARETASVLKESDRIPPLYEGLQQARANIPNLRLLLKELRERFPPEPGRRPFPEALGDNLDKLQDWIPGLTPEDLPPNPELGTALRSVRAQVRELMALLPADAETPKEAKEYRANLLAALQRNRSDLAGVVPLFIDVGVEKPGDLAIVDVELPRDFAGETRQVFGPEDRFPIVAHVLATGRDFEGMALTCKVGDTSLPPAPVSAKAGTRSSVRFEINVPELKLKHGAHAVEIKLEGRDALPFNDIRYVTFAVREPRKVLILVDDARRARDLHEAFEAIYPDFGYRADIRTPPAGLDGYKAVFLLSLAKPDAKLWEQLEKYVKQGNGLCIIPPDASDKAGAYNTPVAQQVMPAQLEAVEGPDKVGWRWNFTKDEVFQNTLLAPFRRWHNDPLVDFGLRPRETYTFWKVKPPAAEHVLIDYIRPKEQRTKKDPVHPALLERTLGAGKVVLFTTLLDYTTTPIWNNYAESNSFYLVIIAEVTKHLAGTTGRLNLNFESGKEAVVAIPPAPRYPEYKLVGDFERVSVSEDGKVRVRPTAPANYAILGMHGENGTAVARFSVNLPAAESDLSRVPVEEIETVLGAAVVPVDRRADITEVLKGYWNQPVELFPLLMGLVLLVLAVENLLANKFYQREPAAEETK